MARSCTRRQTSFVDAFTSTLWVAAVVVVIASGIVAWLLRPKATAKADAMVEAQDAQNVQDHQDAQAHLTIDAVV